MRLSLVSLVVMETKYATCSKCHGSGFIPGYAHVMSGTCFSCSGTGKVKGRTAARQAINEQKVKPLVDRLQSALGSFDSVEWLKPRKDRIDACIREGKYCVLLPWVESAEHAALIAEVPA